MMKVLAPPVSYTLHPHDVQMAHKAVLHYAVGLEALRTWVSKNPKYGDRMALTDMDEEIKAYRELALNIYETAMSKAVQEVERTPFAGRAADEPQS